MLDFKTILWAVLIAIIVGLLSAFFLFSLDFVTQLRDEHHWFIFALPFAGFLWGLLYLRLGNEGSSGNEVFIHAYEDSAVKVSWRMAPLVFLGTLISHVFGASAGREGAAVQMGGSVAAQLARFYPCSLAEKRLLLLMGIGAGFAAVFGTPLAGFVFAFEFFWTKENLSQAAIPVFLASFLAHFVCLFCGVHHTVFPAIVLPDLSFGVVFKVMIAGVIFGLTARLYIIVSKYFTQRLAYVQSLPLRLMLAGFIMAILVWYFKAYEYIGLGIPGIIHAFEEPQAFYVFAIKIFFTALTLSAGFKGGEVTPLFFIGASVGSALVWIIPLPLTFLAALGLVAVFAGAANTPLACICLGAELFGANILIYATIVCICAFLSSALVNFHRNFH